MKPKSTYAQLTLLFGALLLLNFIIIIATLRALTISPSAAQMSSLLNMQLATLRVLLENKNQQQAQKIIANLGLSKKISLAQSPNAQKIPNLKFYRILATQLHKQKFSQVLSQAEAENSKIWIKPQWHSDYWLGFSFQPFVAQVTTFLSVLLVSLLLLSLLAAYFFSRYMLKPFKKLAEMATSIINNQEHSTDITLSGTTEVQAIAKLVKNSAEKIHKSNKEKELFLAGVSHDLRTPLARLRLQTEFLSDEAMQQDMVQEIQEMDAIIEDFINFVRLGSMEECEEINVETMVNQSILDFKKHQLKAEIILQQPQTKIIHKLKPLSCKRILSNLYENAYIYGKEPIIVTIQQQDNSFNICVKDAGNGVAKEDLENLFEPFFKTHNRHNKKGSGLGLSIVQKLAKQNNAKVHAKNSETGGLVVCLSFACESNNLGER